MSDEIQKLAEETARETEAAIPPLAGETKNKDSGSALADGPLDRYGRAFDPNIHVVTGDGKPALYRGRTLIVRKGLQGDRTVAGESPRGTESSLGGQAAPPGTHQEGQPTREAKLLHGDSGPEVNSQEGAIDRAFKAEIDARNTRRFLRRLGVWLAGPEEGEYKKVELENEGEAIQQTAHDWFLEAGIQLPIGAGFMFLFEAGSYLARTWNSERHQERLADLWDWLNGRPPQAAAGKESDGKDRDGKESAQASPRDKKTVAIIIDERRKNIFEE